MLNIVLYVIAALIQFAGAIFAGDVFDSVIIGCLFLVLALHTLVIESQKKELEVYRNGRA